MYYHGMEMFWILAGSLGACYMMNCTFRLMNNCPFTLRVGCFFLGIAGLIIGFKNYSIYVGIYTDYYVIIRESEKIVLWAIVVFLLLGGYQYAKRPECDPKKKAAYFQILWTLIAAIIGFNILIRI